ncbi:MAG: hypothetical protein ACK4KT_03300 [Thermaurantimonas sp.]
MLRTKLKKKWLRFAISGLVLNGFGLSLLGEAIIIKSAGESMWWIPIGTLALICINAGISLVGTAVKYRVHLDNANQYRSSQHRRKNNSDQE